MAIKTESQLQPKGCPKKNRTLCIHAHKILNFQDIGLKFLVKLHLLIVVNCKNFHAIWSIWKRIIELYASATDFSKLPALLNLKEKRKYWKLLKLCFITARSFFDQSLWKFARLYLNIWLMPGRNVTILSLT